MLKPKEKARLIEAMVAVLEYCKEYPYTSELRELALELLIKTIKD
jgi:hypothetical protein